MLIGAGNSWGDVYQMLDQQGVTIPGARVDSDIVSLRCSVVSISLCQMILVFELTHFPGGTSFYFAQYGWAGDNILEYHIILANGTLIEVSENKHEDLFVALKGVSFSFLRYHTAADCSRAAKTLASSPK